MSETGNGGGLSRDARKFSDEVAAAQPLDLGTGEVTAHPVDHDRLIVPIKIEEVGAAILMGVLAVITLLNVVTRYFSNISFAFTEEYSVILLFILVFVGVSSAVVKDSHIRVTFFIDMMSAQWRNVFDIIGLLAMIICFAVLVVYGLDITIDAYELEETSPGLGHPQWIYYAALPLLSGTAGLRVIGALIRRIRMTEGAR